MCTNGFDNEFGEGLRPNAFDISIDGLAGVMAGLKIPIDFNQLQRAMMLCKTVPLPDNEVDLTETEIDGIVYKKVGKRNYGTVDLTFLNSANQLAHDIFMTLLDLQSYHDECGKLITNTYPFDAKLIQYDNNGNPIAGWKLIGNVLSAVTNPDFDRSDTASAQEFNVTLNPRLYKKIPFGELGIVIDEINSWFKTVTDLDPVNFKSTFQNK